MDVPTEYGDTSDKEVRYSERVQGGQDAYRDFFENGTTTPFTEYAGTDIEIRTRTGSTRSSRGSPTGPTSTSSTPTSATRRRT